MRHRYAKRSLNVDTEHRKAIVKNLSISLIEKEKIVTSLTKAKFFVPFIEKLITKVKNTKSTDKIGYFNAVKYLRSHLGSEEAVKKLMDEIGPRFAKRQGGYTRIVKIGERIGDNTMMARVELSEAKDVKTKEKEALKTKTKKAVTKVKEVKENE